MFNGSTLLSYSMFNGGKWVANRLFSSLQNAENQGFMRVYTITTLLNLSLSTFIRRAIHNVKIKKTVIVAGGGEETLTAVSTLLAQCS